MERTEPVIDKRVQPKSTRDGERLRLDAALSASEHAKDHAQLVQCLVKDFKSEYFQQWKDELIHQRNLPKDTMMLRIMFEKIERLEGLNNAMVQSNSELRCRNIALSEQIEQLTEATHLQRVATARQIDELHQKHQELCECIDILVDSVESIQQQLRSTPRADE